MKTLINLFFLVVMILIISFGTGLIMGGPDKAERVISWELKKLYQFGRWTLKLTLKSIAKLCHWAQSKL